MLFLALLHFNLKLTVRLVMMEQDKELLFSVGSGALMREFLERSLSSRDRSVVSFDSLQEGARAVAREPVDLVVYSVDGLKSPPDDRCLEPLADRLIPVIVLSAMNGLEDRTSWLRRGAVDYVVKPFEIEDLSARWNLAEDRTPTVGVARELAEQMAEKVAKLFYDHREPVAFPQ